MNSMEFVREDFKKRAIDLLPDPELLKAEGEEWEVRALGDDEQTVEEAEQAWDEDDTALTERKLTGSTFEDRLFSGIAIGRRPSGMTFAEMKKAFFERYCKYVQTQGERTVWEINFLETDMVELLKWMCVPKIRRRIAHLRIYTADDELYIFSNVRCLDRIMEKIREDRRDGKVRENVLVDAFVICKYATLNYLNYFGLLIRKEDIIVDPVTGEKKLREKRKYSGVRNKDIHATESIEALTQNSDGEDMSDHSNILADQPAEDILPEYRNYARKVLRMYLKSLMNNRNVPPAPLTVMYGRVLYQMERRMNPDILDDLALENMRQKGKSTDPTRKDFLLDFAKSLDETRAAATGHNSAYLWEQVSGKTMWDLCEDSQDSVQENFDKSLTWGPNVRNSLQKFADPEEKYTWAQVEFNKYVTQKNVEQWSGSIHESCLVSVAREICNQEDGELREFIRKFFISGSHFRKLLNDEKGKAEEKAAKKAAKKAQKETNNQKKDPAAAQGDTRQEEAGK